MKDLKSLSDTQLVQSAERLAAEDRRISAEVIRHLFEIERRRLYSSHGFHSMFEFVTKHLGYSESCAHHRISAARLLRDIPEVEASIREGKLSVASVSQAQTFFRAEKRENGKTYTVEEKRQVLQDLEGLSKRATEKYFAELSPGLLQQDRVREVDEAHSEIRFTADQELVAKLERVREIWSHRIKKGDHNELLHLMADLVLEKADPLKKAEAAQAEKPKSLSPEHEAASHSRYIPVAEQNFVMKRDQGRCAFVSADGKRCGSRYLIQFDHYPIPFAMGGPSTRDNLRLACRAHNTLGAIQAFGPQFMSRYLPG